LLFIVTEEKADYTKTIYLRLRAPIINTKYFPINLAIRQVAKNSCSLLTAMGFIFLTALAIQ